MNNQEIESKFYVHNLPIIETRLHALGAACRVPRAFEYNLRYDDPAGSLRAEGKVLRLRKFDDTRLTFKGPSKNLGGALARTEIELIVNDFETAQQLLASLGYQIITLYEKHRAMYELNGALITLDELPYGHFVEIEAGGLGEITALALELKLDPSTAAPTSYLGLFNRLKKSKNLSMPHLTFEAFAGLHTTPEELGLRAADQS